MELNKDEKIKVEYLNEEARICVDMDNTAETYLKRGITKERFFDFVNQVVEMMDKSIKYNLCVELALDKMAVEGDRIYFRTCIGESELDIHTIKQYLKELAYKAVFQGNDFLQTLYEYLAFMDSEQVRTIEDVRRQLQMWTGGKIVETVSETVLESVPTPMASPMPTPATVFASTPSPAPVPVFASSMQEEKTTVDYGTQMLQSQMFENVFQEEEDDDDHGAETGVLNPDFWKTMMQKNDQEEQPGRVRRQAAVASIYYMKTGERITIDKNTFVIGKGADSDFVISNSAISRSHAKIVNQDGKFYIVDTQSTNGTYINGKVIEPNKSIEIKNGDLLRFSNEELKFFTC